MTYENIPLAVNKDDHHFELLINDSTAFIDYKQKGNKVYLIHTEVPESLQGQGVAASLVEKALHYLEDNQLTLVPLCTYVQSYLKKHPAWNRLVASHEGTE